MRHIKKRIAKTAYCSSYPCSFPSFIVGNQGLEGLQGRRVDRSLWICHSHLKSVKAKKAERRVFCFHLSHVCCLPLARLSASLSSLHQVFLALAQTNCCTIALYHACSRFTGNYARLRSISEQILYTPCVRTFSLFESSTLLNTYLNLIFPGVELFRH